MTGLTLANGAVHRAPGLWRTLAPEPSYPSRRWNLNVASARIPAP